MEENWSLKSKKGTFTLTNLLFRILSNVAWCSLYAVRPLQSVPSLPPMPHERGNSSSQQKPFAEKLFQLPMIFLRDSDELQSIAVRLGSVIL